MKKTLIVSGAALSLAAAFAANAASNPANAQFDVTLKVLSACTVSSSNNVAFADTDSTAAQNLSANAAAISVICSKGTKYTVGLKPSNNSSVGAGVMTSTTLTPAETIAYQLYSDAALNTVWGNTNTSTTTNNGVAGTGTGSAQSLTVYAKVTDARTNTPDTYKDTVQIYVRY